MANIVTYARPNRLFRYRGISAKTKDRELKAIEEKYIYCGHYKDMNDPMEGGHRPSSVFASDKTSQLMKTGPSRLMDSLGIASFSETRFHQAMWAHYASSFSSICISYSTRKLLSGLDDRIDLVKMNYSDEPPIMLKNSETASQRAKLALSYKTMKWESEREWRLFKFSPQGPAYYKDPKTVVAIYVGLRAESAQIDEIAARMRPLSIPVYCMQVDKYQLTFKKHRP